MQRMGKQVSKKKKEDLCELLFVVNKRVCFQEGKPHVPNKASSYSLYITDYRNA